MKGNSSLLNKLTIVTPSYNRHDFALRLMKYWSGREPQVIILDGSNESIPAGELSNFNSNIAYYHIPGNMVNRLGRALNLIDSEYVALQSDDEFHIPSSLYKSIEWLESRPDYVACMGRAMGFGINHDGIVQGYLVYPNHKGYEINNSNAASRMYNHLKKYAATTIYSVVRSKVWVNSFKAFVEKEFPVYAIGELQFELSICYFGKSVVLPYLHWMRSSENILKTAGHLQHPNEDISLDIKNQFHLWWSSPEKREAREEFLKITSETLAKTDGRDPEIVSGEVERAMNAYAELSISRCSSGLSNVLREKTKPALKKYLSFYVLNCMRPVLKFYRDLRSRLSSTHYNGLSKSLISAAMELEKNGVSVDYEALKEIENIVLEFHKKRINT